MTALATNYISNGLGNLPLGVGKEDQVGFIWPENAPTTRNFFFFPRRIFATW